MYRPFDLLIQPLTLGDLYPDTTLLQLLQQRQQPTVLASLHHEYVEEALRILLQQGLNGMNTVNDFTHNYLVYCSPPPPRGRRYDGLIDNRDIVRIAH